MINRLQLILKKESTL